MVSKRLYPPTGCLQQLGPLLLVFFVHLASQRQVVVGFRAFAFAPTRSVGPPGGTTTTKRSTATTTTTADRGQRRHSCPRFFPVQTRLQQKQTPGLDLESDEDQDGSSNATHQVVAEPTTTETITNEKNERMVSKDKPSLQKNTITNPNSKKYRMQLFAWLNKPAVEVILALAVLLSSLLVALGTLDDSLPAVAQMTLQNALLILNLVFALDFFARWYAAGQFKLLYLTKPLVVIDVVVILIPLLLDVVLPLLDQTGLLSFVNGKEKDSVAWLGSYYDLPGLQNLLLLRVLRLRRVLTDITTFTRFRCAALGLPNTPKNVPRSYQLQLARVLLSIFTLLSVASGLIYTAEHNVNPGISNYFDALYFGMTTLTTVGFGDVIPMTSQGRFIVSASIIAGVAVIPAQAAKFVEALIESERDNSGIASSRSNKSSRRSERKSENSASASSSNVNGAMGTTKTRVVTDGLGPRGIPIEDPPREWESSPKVKRGKSDETLLKSNRTCPTCRATHHWADATFCWSCGTSLYFTASSALEARDLE